MSKAISSVVAGVALMAALALSHSAHAVTKRLSSTAAATAVWGTASNWDPSGAPGAADDIIFDYTNQPGTKTTVVGLNAAQSADSLTFGGSTTNGALAAFTLRANTAVTTARTLTLTSGNITVDSSVIGQQTLGTTADGILTLSTGGSGFSLSNNSTTQLLNVTTAIASGKTLSFTNAGGGITIDVQLSTTPTFASLSGSSGSATITNGAVATKAITLNASSGTATFGGSINDGAGTLSLVKSGAGVQYLTGVNTYSAGTTASGGALMFGSTSSIGGSGANVTISSGGAVGLQGATDISSIAPRIVTTSAGAIALDTNSSSAIDFNVAGFTAASLGAVGNVTYTGTLTPHGTTYRIGGGGGTINFTNPNAFTGSGNILHVINAGTALISATNNYTGATRINQGGTLKIGVDNALPTTTALTFSLADGATSTTVGHLNLSDFSQTVGTLAARTNTGTANTITIGSGKTLTVNGAFSVGTTVDGSTTLNATGATAGVGTLTMNNAAASFDVSPKDGSASRTATMNLSGLGTLDVTALDFRVGYNTDGKGIVTLANSNIITAARLAVGQSNNKSGQNGHLLNLGTANTLKATDIFVGATTTGDTAPNRSGGTLQFASGLTSPAVTIRGTSGGVSAANLTVATNGGSIINSGPFTSLVDLTPGTTNAVFGAVLIGEGFGSAATADVTGTIRLGTGTASATSVVAGRSKGSAGDAFGTLEINGTTFTNSGSVTLGRASSGTVNQNATGTFNVISGSATVTGDILLGDKPAGAGTAAISGIVNLTGGTLQVGGKIRTSGASTSTFNFDGGTLKAGASVPDFMEGLTAANVMDNGATIDTNGFDITVGQALVHGGINPTDGGLVKSGAGILTLSAANTYTGSTAINSGTLFLTGTGSIASGSAVAVNNGGTLAGIGTANGAVTINGGGIVSPGASPGELNVGSAILESLGVYKWEINDASGAVSTNWDLLDIVNALTINATSGGNEFEIEIHSLTAGNSSGLVPNFVDTQSYQWLIADAGSTISTFAADKFSFDTTNFTNPLGGGQFGIARGDSVLGGNDTQLYLSFTPIPEPSSLTMMLLGFLGLWLAGRRRSVAAF